MKKFLIPPLLFLMSVGTVLAQEADPADNVAGIPIPAGGMPAKENVNIQAHLKAQASTTFGADLDAGYTGFHNEAKATIELKFVDHDGFAWSNAQSKGVKNANKGIRGGIVVEDLKLSNGDGLTLGKAEKLEGSTAYIVAGENGAAPVPTTIAAGAWYPIPDATIPTGNTWVDSKGIYGPAGHTYTVRRQKQAIGEHHNLKDRTFNVTYGDVVAYLNVHDFYIKVSTNPSIKADNTTRYWSAPINGVNDSYYGKGEGLFFGKDNFVGRRYRNSFGGLTVGYQKDDMFNVHGEIASMSGFDRNDKDNVGWGKTWINAYAYKLSMSAWLMPKMVLSINATGGSGQDAWIGAPVGIDTVHGLDSMVKDTRQGLLNTKGTNGAFTVGSKFVYTLPFSDFGWTNGHQLELIAGVDSIIDPYASERILYGRGSTSTLEGSRGTNTTVAVAGAVRYQWPIKEGVYVMKSGDTANRAFYYDDKEDRTSGVTFGMSYARSLGFKRHDGVKNRDEFDQFYKDGANALNVNFSVFEDEENGLIPGLGFAFGVELNDILKTGRTDITGSKINAFNMAAQGELSYAFQGTWLAPKGRIIPYIGAWYSPNNFKSEKGQNFTNDAFDQRLYAKVGILFKQLIPFTEIGVKWESNNIMQDKDKWGKISTTLKITYE